MTRSYFVLFAALNGALAVAGGAFAAHGMHAEAGSPRVLWLKTAAEYQIIHAVAILAVVALGGPRFANYCFAAGIVLFSGSLYLMTATGILALGIVTPFGGLALILGWLTLAWFSWRSRT